MPNRFPWRALLTGIICVIVTSYASILAANRMALFFPSNQFSATSLILCLLLVLAINPLFRLLRLKPFKMRETIIVLIMTMVAAGIPVFGYLCEVIPLAAGLHIPSRNTPQSEWDEKVVPYVSPDFFVGSSLFSIHDVSDWKAFCSALDKGKAAGASTVASKLWQGLDGTEFSEAEEGAMPESLQARVSAVAAGNAAATLDFTLSLSRAIKGLLKTSTLLSTAEEATRFKTQSDAELFNRAAVEKAFTGIVRVADLWEQRRAIDDLDRGVGIHNKESFPVFVKKDEESLAQMGQRFKRYFAASTVFVPEEFKNWHLFYLQLHRNRAKAESPVEMRLWSLLTPTSQQAIAAAAELFESAATNEQIADASVMTTLRESMPVDELFTQGSTLGITWPDEVTKLLALEKRSDRQQLQLQGYYLEGIFGPDLADWRNLCLILTGAKKSLYPKLTDRVATDLPDKVRKTVTMVVEATTQANVMQAAVLKEMNALLLRKDLWRQTELAALRDARMLSGHIEAATDEITRTAANRAIFDNVFIVGLKSTDINFFGSIPWKAWARPLTNWLLLGLLCYLFFFSLNELIFRQWYENEKLVFPIGQLAQIVLTGDDTVADANDTKIPSIFRTPSFYIGFSIAFLALFYNGTVNAKWLSGLNPISLSGIFDNELRGTIFQGLTPGFRLSVFFTCIGLAFLLPTEISFSAWFFFLFMRLQQLIAVWLGHGVDGKSFSKGWLESTNFMTAQGGGAMEVFGLICLWKVRHNMLAVFYRFACPKGRKDFTAEQVKQYTLPSLAFFVASMLLFYFLWGQGVPFFMSLVTYFALLFMTIAMVRLVAECGLIGFQVWFGPLHLMKIFGALKFPALFAARGFGPILLLVSSMFLDVKTFAAPFMMNGRYLAEKNQISRRLFGFTIFVAIILALGVGTLVALALLYDQGIGSMSGWFFRGFPNTAFKTMVSMQNNIGDFQEGSIEVVWFIIGAASCGILVFLRSFLFWVPHPIGLVMFVNPIMQAFWFSFFIAWACKKAAIKYCTTESYKLVRAAFVGLIIGEAAVVVISVVLTLLGYESMGIDLNRN